MRAPRWAGWLLSLAAGLPVAADAAPPIDIGFSLPRAATTSAGVYALDGRLVRTLWRGDNLPAGTHERRWDGQDDDGRPAATGDYEVRLVHHRLSYVWEGVVGNSSAVFGGPQAHRAYLPPTSLAIEGDQAYYAVGYNEQQPGLHGFRLAAPQFDTRPFPYKDAFVAVSMVAADDTRVYWANTGGLVPTSFVAAYDIRTARPASFEAGQPVCLNPRVGGGGCHEEQYHPSVIDLQREAAGQPTGLAVQRQGPVLAVAHGGQRVVRLFDKRTGAPLRQIELPLAVGALNQIAMSPRGDLWVISERQVLRYTNLAGVPRQVAARGPLVRPLALATSPVDDDMLWVAEGDASQQLKRFDGQGRLVQMLGRAGGYATEPEVHADKLCFNVRPGRQQTALALSTAHALWVVDTCNNRMLRFDIAAAGTPTGAPDVQVAYLPAFYASTVDHGNPRRVFANFLEFDAEAATPWQPGRSWRLVRNWLAALPPALADERAFNGLFGGFLAVETLSNGRTYGLLSARGRQVIVELPAAGPLRVVRVLAPTLPGATPRMLYENGDLGHAVTGPRLQTVLRQALAGFDAAGDPRWDEPAQIASVPIRAGTPHYRGAFSGGPPRFPRTGSGRVVFFDQSVAGNEGFHLGAAASAGTDWLWQASPTGPLDGKGSFQTKAIDQSLHYGGNAVLTHGRHIVYGYHGEFYRDLQTRRVGQANQFMHFDESGLFLGQFGQPSTRPAPPSQPGMSGNAFSPVLVAHQNRLYLYHNDESSHGGVHRWRIDGADDVADLRGRGPAGGRIVLR